MKKEKWNKLRQEFPHQGFSIRTLAIWVCDAALLALSFVCLSLGGWYLLLSWALLSLVLLHIYLFQHEATHNTIAKNRIINDTIGHLFSWIIFVPYLARKRSHLLHHRYTGHPTLDPANKRAIDRFSVMTDETAKKLDLIWKSWIPLLVVNDRVGLWLDPFQKTHVDYDRPQLKIERIFVRVYLALYLITALLLFSFYSLSFVLLWYLPALVVLLFIEELINLPHHAETPLLETSDKPLHFSEQYAVSHSCEHIPFWSNFILLNFNRHIPHHLFPWIAWYQLPKLDEDIRQHMNADVLNERTRNEIKWSLINRKRSLLKIMGHYFDKR